MLQKQELTHKLHSLAIDRTSPPQSEETSRNGWWLAGVGGLALVAAAAFAVPYWPAASSAVTGFFDSGSTVTAQPQGQKIALAPNSQQSAAQSKVTAPASVAPVSYSPPVLTRSSTIVGSGFVEARRVVLVKPEMAGRIVSLDVQVGDQVKKGQPLAILDQTLVDQDLAIAQSQINQAKAKVSEARSALAEAQDPLRRLSILAKKGVASKASVSAAKLKVARLQSGVASAQASLEIAKLKASKLEAQKAKFIARAPFDGVIVDRLSEVGKVVASGEDGGPPNEGLVRLIDPDDLVIDVDIAEINIARIRAGLTGIANLDAYPDRKFTVTVLSIVPTASRQKGTITVRLAPTPIKGEEMPDMLANMVAKVSFKISDSDAREANRIPTSE